MDSGDIGDEHGRPKIQGCDGCDGSLSDGWVDAFVARVAAKAPVPGTDGAARSARPTTL